MCRDVAPLSLSASFISILVITTDSLDSPNHSSNKPDVKVNLDALARYTRQRGGWALASPYMEGFKCQALAFGMEEKEGLEEMRLAFEGVTQEFGPESFSTLQRAVKDEVFILSGWVLCC